MANDGRPQATSTFSIPRRSSPRASPIVFQPRSVIVRAISSQWSSAGANPNRYAARLDHGGAPAVERSADRIASSTSATLDKAPELGLGRRRIADLERFRRIRRHPLSINVVGEDRNHHATSASSNSAASSSGPAGLGDSFVTRCCGSALDEGPECHSWCSRRLNPFGTPRRFMNHGDDRRALSPHRPPSHLSHRLPSSGGFDMSSRICRRCEPEDRRRVENDRHPVWDQWVVVWIPGA